MNKNWICLGFVAFFLALLTGCAAEIPTPRNASSGGLCAGGDSKEQAACWQQAYDRMVRTAAKPKTEALTSQSNSSSSASPPFPKIGEVPYVALQSGTLIMPVWTPNAQGNCSPGYDIVVENSKDSGYPNVEIQGSNLAFCGPIDAVAIAVKEGSGLRWAIVVPAGSRQRYTYLGDGPFRITTVAYGPVKPDLTTGQFRAAALGLSRHDDLRFNRKHAAWDWTVKSGNLY